MPISLVSLDFDLIWLSALTISFKNGMFWCSVYSYLLFLALVTNGFPCQLLWDSTPDSADKTHSSGVPHCACKFVFRPQSGFSYKALAHWSFPSSLPCIVESLCWLSLPQHAGSSLKLRRALDFSIFPISLLIGTKLDCLSKQPKKFRFLFRMMQTCYNLINMAIG